MDDDEDIHDRLERLEATVAEQQQTIEQLSEPPAIGRRSVVGSLLGAGALGGLAGYGSQSARAEASEPAGQVGTGEEPVDVEAWNLTVQNEADGVGGVENPLTETLEADGNDVTGVGALEADQISTSIENAERVESDRSLGTEYQNTNDYDIYVFFQPGEDGGGPYRITAHLSATANNISNENRVSRTEYDSSDNRDTLFFKVPSGAYYQIEGEDIDITVWAERGVRSA